MNFLKKIFFDILFSPKAFASYILLFAIAIGAATFIENDFGTSAAQKVIFQARWFEVLLLLFSLALIANIIRFKMVKQKKWAILTFHLAMIIIIIGAAITRYTGFEGIMHIRENDSSSTFISSEMYLKYKVSLGGQNFEFDEPVLFASLGDNTSNHSYNLNGRILNVEVTEFLPNPEEVLKFDENGLPILKIVFGGSAGRQEYYLRKGEVKNYNGTIFNFSNNPVPGSIIIQEQNGQPFIQVSQPFEVTVMATQTKTNLTPGIMQPLQIRSLYASGNQRFVFGDFTPSGKLTIESGGQKMTNESLGGVQLTLAFNGENRPITVYGRKGSPGIPNQQQLGDALISVSYGAREVQLPFSLFLRDFQMERYPGTNNAASYASEVTLMDASQNIQEDRRIYMNNILIHRGYRFFQSSFDQDELGTYLSVNHDFWGTWVSYLGYFLLTLGMILTFFSQKSRFTEISKKLQKMRSVIILGIVISLCLFPNSGKSQNIIDEDHAQLFSKAVMQDFRGRMKPLHTFNNEVLRKLSRKTEYEGLNADQVVLGMTANPKDWYSVPLIKGGKHQKITQILPSDQPLLAYKDFFNTDGTYKLKEEIRAAYNVPEKERGVYEKELMKIDERVNICNMIFSGSYLKVLPIPNDANNTWISPQDLQRNPSIGLNNPFAQSFYSSYITALRTGLNTGNWNDANQLVDNLEQYQIANGSAVLPSKAKVSSEILLNDLSVFSRLSKSYGLLGLAFLTLVFMAVFKPQTNLHLYLKIFYIALWVAFAFHTIGLGLRWYVSGRAPWSNGYESMIYIAWTTTLAGLIFSRKSSGVLAATNVLSATILMVAGLSWLDPEITPLVPVLKSYWLTIHVSLEAGSYGFLMLGAIIGLLNLILISFANKNNGERIFKKVKEMTYISEMTLIGGLFMVSIGTYLGGVWANESWGRYWGWDAKETWALVTILVYAFILHMRFIPGLKSLYAFNVASLFGWATVLMTYFGVNYYLSGLHSYAAGDPVPIPDFVYYAVILLTLISLFAFWRYKICRKELQKVNFTTL